MNLQDTINQLSLRLVDAVVDEIAANIGDLKTANKIADATPLRSTKKMTSGRLKRRSAADIDKAMVDVVMLLKKSPDGMRSEAIRSALGLEPKEMPRIMKQALAEKLIVILGGQKRATTYGVASKKAPKASAKSTPKKKAAPKKKSTKKTKARKTKK